MSNDRKFRSYNNRTSSDIQDRQTRRCEDCGTLFSVTARERSLKVWACASCREIPKLVDPRPVGGRAGVRGVASAFASRQSGPSHGGGSFGGRR